MTFRNFVLASLLVVICVVAEGQSISSPYTENGLGEIAFEGLVHNYAMGEVGIGTPTRWHVNIQNPAMLMYNKFSTFQVGLRGDVRYYKNSRDTSSQTSASLQYLSMAFPVVKNRWTASFSLLPFTFVNYNTFSRDSIGDALRVSQSRGEGGLSQLVWGNGFRIYKTLLLGVKASYIFGTITKEESDQLIGDNTGTAYSIVYGNETAYSDFDFSLGLAYRWKIKEQKYINLGATYSLSGDLKGSRDRYVERLSSSAAIRRTDLAAGETVSFSLPKSYGFGFSFEKLYRYKIGVDMQTKRWKSTGEQTNGLNLRNTANLALGAEWTPDYQSVNKYISRVTYRMGVQSKQLPYLVNNTEINDFGINFGASFPVSVYSSLDAAFKYGFRGTTQNGLIKENYFQIVIGATINDNQWFIKRRYD